MTRSRLRCVVVGPHVVPAVALTVLPPQRVQALPGADPLRLFGPRTVRLIGALQLASVLGVLAPSRPAVLSRRLRTAGALGLAGVQTGAAVAHLRTNGRAVVPVNLTLAGAAVALARREARR